MDPVPAVGQHTEAILRELGHSEAAIAALRAAGGDLIGLRKLTKMQQDMTIPRWVGTNFIH
jgi:hypothetical protein